MVTNNRGAMLDADYPRYADLSSEGRPGVSRRTCVPIDNALCRTGTLPMSEGAKGLRSPFSLAGRCLEGRCA